MKKTIKVFVIGIILLSCKTINIAQSNRSVFLEKWRDASYKSISDQMVIYKNDSVFIKSLINTKTSLLSSSEDHGLRKYFYDSCLKNNDKIFGNEFYILETRTRGEVMQFDFYVQSKQKHHKTLHYNSGKSCLLLGEKNVEINEHYSLEKIFNENNPAICSDYFPLDAFIISHFENDQVVSKVYSLPCKETLYILGQTIKLF